MTATPPLRLLASAAVLAMAFIGGAGSLPAAAEPADPAAQTRLISLGKCLTQPAGATDFTQLVLASCADLPTQVWRLPPRGSVGAIRNADGRCVDVRGVLPVDFTPVIAFPCHGNSNQLWRHSLDGRLIGLGDKCLDVQSSSEAEGAPLILFRCNGQANQRWRAESFDGWNASHLLAGGKVGDLATAPSAPGVVYAAAGASGLFGSEDDGITWAPKSRGVVDGPVPRGVESVAVDPGNADVLLIVAGGRILRSIDGGVTFAPVYGEKVVRRVFWDRQGERLFALAAGAELLRSDDAGSTWIHLAFIADSRLDFTEWLEGPGSSPSLWAAAPSCAFFCGGGVWRSDDGGRNWLPELNGEIARLRLYASGQRLYALDDESLRQRDLAPGSPWQLVKVFPDRLKDLHVDDASGLLLVAGEGGKTYRSLDGGLNWTTHETGLRRGESGEALEWVSRIVQGSTGLLAAVESTQLAESARLLRSLDFGATWEPAGTYGWTAGTFADLELENGQTALAAGDAGVYRSVDGGSAWSVLKSLEPGVTFAGVVRAPDNPHALFVTGSRPTPGPFLWRSLDAGASWSPVATNTSSSSPVETRDFVATRHAGHTVLVTALSGRFAGAQVAGVLRSADLGATWEAVGLGGRVAQLAKGPAPGEIFAGGEFGLSRSLDGGDSWSPLREEKVEALAVAGDQVYAAGDGLFRHRALDAWQSWSLPSALGRPTVLRASNDQPGLLYLGTADQGVFRSFDHGRSWHAVNPGLPARPVVALELTPGDPRRPWAGVRGHGVFRGRFGDDTPQSLDHGRFLIDVSWRDFVNTTGAGFPGSLTADTTSFWFFDADNLELAVKILDGRTLNGHFWIFFASLTNVEFDLHVVDLWTGQRRAYHNPAGTLASFGDTSALPSPGSAGEPAPEPLRSWAADSPRLTLAERFEVEIAWVDPQGHSGSGLGRTVTEETGYFYFFGPNNVEVLVKVLDGRAINGHFWVFFGGLSNVEYTVTVRDLQTDRVQIYHNPQGQFASQADIVAF